MNTESHFRTVTLGPARLAVKSIAALQPFYEEVLGLRVLAREHHHLDLALQDGEGVLVRLEEGMLPSPYPRSVGLFHLAILLPSRAALARFVRHLRRKHVPFGAGDHGVSEALYLEDPEGNGWEIYADRPVSAWPAPTPPDRVTMFTAPVDLNALAKAVSPDEAENPLLPRGTRLGHVHLRVQSLSEAGARFVAKLNATLTTQSYPGAHFFAWDGYHHHFGANLWSRDRFHGMATHGLIELSLERRSSPAASETFRLAFDSEGQLQIHPAGRDETV